MGIPNPPDLNDCQDKCRCPTGPYKKMAYSCSEPCNEGCRWLGCELGCDCQNLPDFNYGARVTYVDCNGISSCREMYSSQIRCLEEKGGCPRAVEFIYPRTCGVTGSVSAGVDYEWPNGDRAFLSTASGFGVGYASYVLEARRCLAVSGSWDCGEGPDCGFDTDIPQPD